MPRYLLLILLLASATVRAGTSLRVDNKLLTIGDSAAKVQQLMGEPTMRVMGVPTTRVMSQPAMRAFMRWQSDGLPNDLLSFGEQWQYAQDGKTIVITIIGGRVANFETLY